jgi:hypothetical protein
MEERRRPTASACAMASVSRGTLWQPGDTSSSQRNRELCELWACVFNLGFDERSASGRSFTSLIVWQRCERVDGSGISGELRVRVASPR